MTDRQGDSAMECLPHKVNSFLTVATDAVIIGVACLGAWLALPLMYAERFNRTIWCVSIVAFVGFPLLAGIVRRQPSLPATLIAGILLLACPVVYQITDPLPVRFEMLRDAFFLATGSTVTFVSAGWTVSFVRARQWIQMFATGALNVVAACSIPIMITVYMYLE